MAFCNKVMFAIISLLLRAGASARIGGRRGGCRE